MNYPTIGIRPVIDGRWGGVRESLEAQTLSMARAAAALIESSLRYADGTAVRCVLAPSTIGGGAEAAAAAALFAREGVCATLSVTPCWCYGSETMDLDPTTIKAVWGFNGTERPGAVYLAAAMSAHAQRGLPAFAIYGRDVQDADDAAIPPDVAEKLLRFARAAVAAGSMRGRAYVGIGGVSMGIAGSYTDARLLQDTFGMRPEWVDMTEVLRRITLGIFDPQEYAKARAWVAEKCPEGADVNAGKELPDIVRRSKYIPAGQDWDFAVKMALIFRDIVQGNPALAALGWHEEALGRNGIAGGFQGQRMWTDWLPNGDFAEAILASSFDWNGARPPLAFATENDCLNGLTMLLLQLLTGQAPCFSDVRTFWSPDAIARVTGYTPEGVAAGGVMHLINSGATALDATGASQNAAGGGCMKPWWEMGDADIDACLAATDWCRANYQYFRGGGYSSHFRTEAEMPVTMARLNLVEGAGPVLQIAQGYTAVLPDGVHGALDRRTDPTWPTTWFAPILTGEGAFRDVYGVMAAWGANHGAWTHGHVGADLITLASMLRIPVTMHNVPAEQVYRPHLWGLLGDPAAVETDMRACGRAVQ